MVSDQEFHQSRSNFVLKLSLLIRTIKIYNPENETIDRHVEECFQLMSPILRTERRLSLRVLTDSIFLNEERVRVRKDTYQAYKFFMEELKEKKIGEVLVTDGATAGDFKGFLHLLTGNDWGDEEDGHPLANLLIQNNIHSITVKPLDPRAIDERIRREEAKKVYFRSVAMVREVCQNLLEDKPLALRKAKRLSQSMVDLVLHDKTALLGLSTIKNYDEYTYNHSVNVSIYSLTLGAKLGLSKRILAELGLAALFHDVGKTKIPDTILNKPGKLNEAEWEVMRAHPSMGVEEMLEFHRLAEVKPRILFGVFDHHLNLDLSGYPKMKRKKKQTLFGRIITIADVYDAMTTPRCYRKEPYSPVDTLKLMWKDCGVHFDPILYKVFVNAIGVYPVGSLVQLDGDELGIVYDTNQPSNLLDRPTVLAVTSEGARKGTIDLSDRDERTGAFKRSIIRCLDPKKYNICVQDHFL